MNTVLSVQNMNVTYVNKSKRVMAVRNASFSISKGDSLGLVGESGSGKSTLAIALLGLLPKETTEITGKAIFLEDTDLLSISEKEMNELRWKKLAVVFQKAMILFPPSIASAPFSRIFIGFTSPMPPRRRFMRLPCGS